MGCALRLEFGTIATCEEDYIRIEQLLHCARATATCVDTSTPFLTLNMNTKDNRLLSFNFAENYNGANSLKVSIRQRPEAKLYCSQTRSLFIYLRCASEPHLLVVLGPHRGVSETVSRTHAIHCQIKTRTDENTSSQTSQIATMGPRGS